MQKTVGDYELFKKLGQGQFGIVYKARNVKTEKFYAVKTIPKRDIEKDPKSKELFTTETEVMGKFDHPNLLHLTELIETESMYYMVIDFCDNGDLMGYIDKNGALGEEDSIYFLMQIMNAFKELHGANVMHRDFKPENVFLDNDRVVIGDFGFSKMGFKRTNTVLGTPITMAPEILASEGKTSYSSKVDLFSIGIVFFWMIYGEPPWDPPTMKALHRCAHYASGENLRFPYDPQISEDCQDLLIKLTNPNPEERIGWLDFFNHSLFKKYEKENLSAKATTKIGKSILMKSNMFMVMDIFKANQKSKTDTYDLISDPFKLKNKILNYLPMGFNKQ